jgi:hypothetical protein
MRKISTAFLALAFVLLLCIAASAVPRPSAAKQPQRVTPVKKVAQPKPEFNPEAARTLRDRHPFVTEFYGPAEAAKNAAKVK